MSPQRGPEAPPGRPHRVVIAGGGTGGHAQPGVALGTALLRRGSEVRLVGTP
ncbi:MAG TPA: glycosyltransferase, partial [Actinomycetota bacterium]|nr:glycosyltransferase [Actinomycetota bacterium]